VWRGLGEGGEAGNQGDTQSGGSYTPPSGPGGGIAVQPRSISGSKFVEHRSERSNGDVIRGLDEARQYVADLLNVSRFDSLPGAFRLHDRDF
jgi:hypothetical protein